MKRIIMGLLSFIASVYPLSQDEFFQVLKKKRELLSSGKIEMKIYELKWANEGEYKIFSEELQKYIYSQPLEFKKWFIEKEKSLPIMVGAFKWEKVTYYFEGIEKFPYRREHYIKEIPLEEFKRYISDVIKNQPNIIVRVPFKTEYSWDGTILKEYEVYLTEEYGGENILTISTDENETAKFFKLWLIDYSFAPLENLPKFNKNFKFAYEKDRIIINDSLIFIPSFSCGCVHVLAHDKTGKLAREFITGAYSLINGIVHLPYFSSDATILATGEVRQTLYIIEKYELRPISNDEFSIKLVAPTKIIDYSFGKEPQIYYFNGKPLNKKEGGR
jgi:hypothetical protein